jgi:CBS domain-containing protein
MWWPAIGGIAVGIIGYFSPRTLGVGYNNITDILAGSMPVQVVLSLCLLKFLSWALALGSGTSGGTLAPLLTIGGATGVLIGNILIYYFPHSELSLPLAALVGMSAMFAGASRALLTSIIFALETTMQSNALLPLLSACIASYFVSFFLMENTIMTEKIARRGTKTPDSYEPDILEKINVGDLEAEEGLVLSEENTIGEVRDWLKSEKIFDTNYFIIISKDNEFKGIISSSSLNSTHHNSQHLINSLIKRKDISIAPGNNLKKAVKVMAKENIDVLPVISEENKLIGILTYRNILSVYNDLINHNDKHSSNISLRRNSLKVLVRGQKLITLLKKKNKY